MGNTDQTPAPGTQTPPKNRPARPADLIGKPDKGKFKVYAFVEPGEPGTDGHHLVFLAEVGADTREEACWAYSESNLGREEAMSDNPPKLVALSAGRGGVGEPRTYPLEPAVRRKK